MNKTSANNILLYEFCPHKWELFKSGGKEKKQQFAFYRFSSALHYAINKSISEMGNIFEVFDTYWERYHYDYPLWYEDGDNWESLLTLGNKFLGMFNKEFPAKNITPILTENRLKLTTPEWEFTGQPDLIGFRDDRNSYLVIDFKVTKEEVDEFWVHASDQMTASAMLTANEFMLNSSIDIIICNFIRSSEEIKWIESVRSQADIDAYKAKVNHFIYLMHVNGYHPKRSLYAYHSPCRWCGFQEDCLKTDMQLSESLKNIFQA